MTAGSALQCRTVAGPHRSGLRELHDRRRLWLGRRATLAADLLAVDRQEALRNAELDRRAVGQFTGEQHLRQRVLHPFLDHALQGARAVGRIVPLVGQPLPRLGVEAERVLTVLEQPVQALELYVDDLAHVLAPEAMEEDDFIDAVQELRPEMAA